MSLFDMFKPQEDFEFVDESTVVYSHYPIQLAKDVKPHFKQHQETKYGSYKFVNCPGMHDYSRMGYIVPAWSNIHIKANKAGQIALVGSRGDDAMKRGTTLAQPRNMATDITDGMFQIQDIDSQVWIVPSPWKIFGRTNGVSALVLPAFYHSDFLDDINVFPGVVDYQGFNTMNFIFSPKRKCEFTIQAGTPLLHVIPFITTKNIQASYGPGSTEQKHSYKILKWYHEKNFYRKYYMIKKKFSIFKKVPD